MKYLLFLMMVILMVTGCGSSEPAPDAEVADTEEVSAAEEAYTLPEADSYLVVADSIGVEMGDSNFVFGAITAAGFNANGDVAILDMQKYSLSLFTHDGEFIRSIGREGSGPGEFRMPTAFAFRPEGGLVVADGMGSKLAYFDENYEYLSETPGFSPSPPVIMVAVNGMEIIGMKPDYDQNEDGMSMGFTAARWGMESAEPLQVYYSKLSPFNPADISSVSANFVACTATTDGRVFTAPMSTEEYTFTAWSAEGEELYTFEKEDFERVEKNQTEMDLEIELMNARMISQGMPPSMANWEPDIYRNAISELFVDGLDRLWVAKGTDIVNTFDVFDLDGNLLFTCALDAGEGATNWRTIIGKEYFISFDMQPEDYPRVYFGDLPGIE